MQSTYARFLSGGRLLRTRVLWSQVSSAQLEVFWAAMSHVQGCTTTPQARSQPKPIKVPVQRCCTLIVS